MTELAALAERWGKLGGGESLAAPPPVPPPKQPQYYVPLEDAADEFVRWSQSHHERIYTGIAELDAEMRGIAPREMALILGYSHSGKTLVLMEMLKANRLKSIAFFTPDEPRTLVLIKLACALHGYDALDLERAISRDDQEMIGMLRATANEYFPNLAVYDDSMSLSEMDKALNELSDLWGDKPDLVVFDYLELLQGGGEDVPTKANTLKAWGKRRDVPLLVLHQTSRSAGANGKSMTISSGAFGGEQQATHIVGVRRKKFDIQEQIREITEKVDRGTASERQMERLDELGYLLRIHDTTITINLVKNKRPGGRLVDDLDFEIAPGSGQLRRLRDGDLPSAVRSTV